MKNSKLWGACLGLLIVAAQPSVAAVIDFENVLPGTRILAGTNLQGLEFDQDIFVDRFAFLDGPATDGVIARNPSPQGGAVSGTFQASVSRLKIGAGDVCCDLDTITLSGFDYLGNLIQSRTIVSRDSQFLTIEGQGIVRFALEQSSGGFDNIEFEFANVPIPASQGLLGAALILLGLRRWRAA